MTFPAWLRYRERVLPPRLWVFQTAFALVYALGLLLAHSQREDPDARIGFWFTLALLPVFLYTILFAIPHLAGINIEVTRRDLVVGRGSMQMTIGGWGARIPLGSIGGVVPSDELFTQWTFSNEWFPKHWWQVASVRTGVVVITPLGEEYYSASRNPQALKRAIDEAKAALPETRSNVP